MKIMRVLLLSVVTLLGACSNLKMPSSLIQNHETDYLRSENLPPLKVPSGVATYPPDTYYTIQDTAASVDARVSMKPPRMKALYESIEKKKGGNNEKR